LGKLVAGDDGLPVEEVGPWATEKQELLGRYVDISRGARAKFTGPFKPGTSYIDLFCGPGRCKIKDGPFIDGSCVTAWRKSVESGVPFTHVYISDKDDARVAASTERLRRLGAPVRVVPGPAVSAAISILKRIEPHGLHFAFVDPFSLGALDFRIFKTLTNRKHMDILVHLSKMDLQRNLDDNLGSEAPAFDAFAPGWKNAIDVDQTQRGIRTEIIDYWRDLIAGLGTEASTEMRLLKGSRSQHLYWLLLLANHHLAHKFWKAAANIEKQGELF
jgi:three-Cys-motif partner protein